MIINPKVRGFICTTAHPDGCYKVVEQQVEYILSKPRFNSAKNVLVIGASTGYGLASRIALSFGGGAKTIGVFFEKPASEKRTASPGWYNSAAFEQLAAQHNLYAKSINGDAFSLDIKQQVADLIKQDFAGRVDLIVYSLAAPRRQMPDGSVFNSVLKPIANSYEDKTVDIMTGVVSDIQIQPATSEEIYATEKVMGGEDWQDWIEFLSKQGLLSNKSSTIAYSYIGPEITYPIYRHGTIGKAKLHLETTAEKLNNYLFDNYQGSAYVAVNKGIVTQASSAIPVVPLYISLLYKVMKQKNCHEKAIHQMWRLFAEKYYVDSINLDEKQRLRVDDWELREDIQQSIFELWNKINSENLTEISDIAGYREEFYNLFGFNVAGIDYSANVNPQVDIISLSSETVNA